METSKPIKCKYNYRLSGFSPDPQYYTYQANLNAMELALLERKFFVKDGKGGFALPPRPKTDKYFSSQLQEITQHFSRHCQYTPILSEKQFLQHYDGRRRQMYEQAFRSLDVVDLTVVDSEISYFVKVEKTQKPVTRGIDPRNPRYHVTLGRYIKPVEKFIYKVIDKLFESRTIFKGLNSFDRGMYIYSHWMSFKNPVAVGLDASRFDQHVSKSALKWEHAIYKMFFKGDKLLSKLLRWQLTTTGRGYTADGKVKFKSEGGRSSGDMNTALGNCLIMSSLVFAYARKMQVKIKLANDGDDCVVFMEAEDYQKFIKDLPSWFLSMGFNMTVEQPVYEIEHIEFCQSNPIWTPEGYIMVRNVNKALSKDCLSIKPLDSQSIFKSWVAAVGLGGLSLAGQIPIWQNFYKRLHTLSQGAKPLSNDPTQETGLKFLSKGMKRGFGKIHPQTRASFYVATGILPDLQVAIEEQLNNLKFDVESSTFSALALMLA